MKITLKTLPNATAQQVFDQVATHLLTQGKESMQCGRCFYRLGDLSCAAGCLIADDEYDQSFETKNWFRLVADGRVPNAHEPLIRDLQIAHDTVPVRNWPEKLIRIAHDYDLSAAVVEKFNEQVTP